MKGQLPTIAFRDLEIQQRENDLVGASFGRGMYVLDDYSLLRELAQKELTQSTLFPIKDAWQYFARGDWGYARKGVFGDNFFTAPNPSYGATFKLFLSEKLLSQKALRKKEEPNSYPEASTLQKEDFEQAPRYFIQVRDEEGRGIANVAVQNRKGFQQVAWSLSATIYEGDKQKQIRFVPEGSYTAQLYAQQPGKLEAIGIPHSFQVKHLPLSPEKHPEDLFTFYSEAAQQLMQAEQLEDKLEKLLEKWEKQQHLLLLSASQNGLEQLAQKRQEVLGMQYMLLGNQSKKERFEYFLPGIRDRLRRVFNSQWQSDQITHTHRDNLEIAKTELGMLWEKYRKLAEI